MKRSGLVTTAVLAASIFGSLLTSTAHAGTAVTVAADISTHLSKSTLVGRTARDRAITIVIALPSRDPAGLAAFNKAVSSPGNTLFRQYLTPAEFADRFGGNATDYASLIAWAQAHGLKINERAIGRNILSLTGSASRLEALFGVTINDYRAPDGRVFYSAASAPTLSPDLARRIIGVLGLSGYNHHAPLVKMKPSVVKPLPNVMGSGPNGAYSAADLRSIYNIPAQLPGQKEVVAIFEQGGFARSDVATYFKQNKLPDVPVVVRNVDGFNGAIDDPRVEMEAVLDIDMLVGMNPATSKVLVYEDGSDSFGVALVDALTAMANDNKAHIVSISYGLSEYDQGNTQMQAENAVLEQLPSQGITVLASAGDDGAYPIDSNPAQFTTLNVEDPASQPFVTAVGGTTLFSNGGTYYAEQAWNWLDLPPSGEGATGGGVSTLWPIPFYQTEFNVSLMTTNGGSATYRNVPDVAAVGDPITGVAVYSKMNGGWVTVGGTSVSAPVWGGFLSVVDAAEATMGMGHLGFFNPAIYYLWWQQPPKFQLVDYNDVTEGNNGHPMFAAALPGFNAGIGYDNTTGWGSMNGLPFLADLTLNTAWTGKSAPPAPTELKATTTSTSITLSWTAAKGAKGYLASGEAFGLNFDYYAPVQLVTGTTATWTGLSPNKTYEMNVYSVSKNGATQSTTVKVRTAK